MKAILITCVSMEEQKEAGNSLPAQVARLEKYCQVRDFGIIKSFSFDESGYKNQREAFCDHQNRFSAKTWPDITFIYTIHN